MEFHTLSLQDREAFLRATAGQRFLASEYHFEQLYLWREPDEIEIARENDHLFIRENHIGCFLAPLGGDRLEGVEMLAMHCRKSGESFLICSCDRSLAEALQQTVQYDVSPMPLLDDYIYSVADLIALSGKKYQAKRNHIAKFSKEHHWSFEPYVPEDRASCQALAEAWAVAHGVGQSAKEELQAISVALREFETLGFSGGVLRVDGQIVAFTIGQKADDQMGIIHFEKTAPGWEEAYPVVNRAFLKQSFSDLVYINRQDDMGLPGLKKAKESYHPVCMAEKYRITLAK